jgi:hypothetical protein
MHDPASTDYQWRSMMEGRIIHLDETFSKSISQLAQNQASMQATLDTAVRTLDAVSTRINQPPASTNWTGIISCLVGVILLMSAGVVMKVSPIEANQVALSREIATNTAVITERAYYIGKQEALHETLRAEVTALHLDSKVQSEQISVLRERAAVADWPAKQSP